MRAATHFLLFVAALAAGAIQGTLLPAHAASSSNNRPDLKVSATVEAAAPEGQPILVVHLENESGHELRVPDPPLLCRPAPGALSIETRFTPANGGKARRPTPCNLQVDDRNLPDIRERAKSWIAIEPGRSYVVRRPLAMGVNALAAGTYRLRVVYTGPTANLSDQEKLEEADIAAPTGTFRSRQFIYKVKARK